MATDKPFQDWSSESMKTMFGLAALATEFASETAAMTMREISFI